MERLRGVRLSWVRSGVMSTDGCSESDSMESGEGVWHVRKVREIILEKYGREWKYWNAVLCL